MGRTSNTERKGGMASRSDQSAMQRGVVTTNYQPGEKTLCAHTGALLSTTTITAVKPNRSKSSISSKTASVYLLNR